MAETGSSPRGRGTLGLGPLVQRARRFIPAWAGNTMSQRAKYILMTVHPRVGGEHTHQEISAMAETGSSPRGRGTLRPGAVLLGTFFH